MTIDFTTIKNTAVQTAKKIAGKPMAVASKVIGAGTIASVLYDAHINGREKAFITDELSSADRFYRLHKQYMTSDKNSATVSQMKNGWFLGQMSNNCAHFGNKIRGYLSGFGETVFNNVPRLLLSAVSLRFNKLGKVAGTLLALDWGKTYITDVMGLGAKDPNRKY
jgi:hypothetical protein